MGKLVVVVGNSGIGKTSLALKLSEQLALPAYLEQHHDRPFQRLFSGDLRAYALANQVDYLMFRAEQEAAIRTQASHGIQDGGLDLDFHVFTRHFLNKGYLANEEHDLCRRLYELARRFLPMPDVIVSMKAPMEVVLRRFARRKRDLEIAKAQDLSALQALLDEWLAHVCGVPVVAVDAAIEDAEYSGQLEALAPCLKAHLESH